MARMSGGWARATTRLDGTPSSRRSRAVSNDERPIEEEAAAWAGVVRTFWRSATIDAWAKLDQSSGQCTTYYFAAERRMGAPPRTEPSQVIGSLDGLAPTVDGRVFQDKQSAAFAEECALGGRVRHVGGRSDDRARAAASSWQGTYFLRGGTCGPLPRRSIWWATKDTGAARVGRVIEGFRMFFHSKQCCPPSGNFDQRPMAHASSEEPSWNRRARNLHDALPEAARTRRAIPKLMRARRWRARCPNDPDGRAKVAASTPRCRNG